MLFTTLMRGPVAFALTAATLLLATTPSQAIPAFARQTGKACSSCHFQHNPTLNDVGMEFKSGGYVDIRNRPVSGPDLSVADSLYASILTKIRYQKTDGTDGQNIQTGLPNKSTHSGEWQFPDEFALLMGGRVGKNVGFVVEAALANGADPLLAGFKLPALWEVAEGYKVGAVPFSTDTLGASYGFELLSTGAVRNIRISEARTETSAQQYVFFDSAGPAAGISLVLHNPLFFVTLTPFTPNHLPGGDSQLGGLDATYFRAAVTPTVAGWSLGGGVQAWSGNNVRVAKGAIALFKTQGVSIDAQAQGSVASMPLGVYFAHSRAAGSAAGQTPNLFNANPNARTATTLTAELGVLPQKATLMASYRKANTGAASSGSDNAFSLGATYQIYQNLQLQAVHSSRQKDNGIGRYGPHDPANGTIGGSALTTLLLTAVY